MLFDLKSSVIFSLPFCVYVCLLRYKMPFSLFNFAHRSRQGLSQMQSEMPGQGGGGQPRIRVEPAGQFWQQLSARGRKRRAARVASKGKLKWSSTAKSARLTGLYLIIAGLCLLFAPESTFGLLFDVRTIATGWIQVFGVIATALGMYYVGTAIGDTEGSGARGFYASTVAGRIFIFAAFCFLVSQKFVEQQLLLLAFLNLLSAASMYYALQQ